MSPNFLIIHPDNEIFEHTRQHIDTHLLIKYIHILLYYFTTYFARHRHTQRETKNIEKNINGILLFFLASQWVVLSSPWGRQCLVGVLALNEYNWPNRSENFKSSETQSSASLSISS